MANPTLRERRDRTIGRHSPLFYDEPLEFVSGSGVWLTARDGTRYLDGYNNVPHVGHANERVVTAISTQAATLNIHTRYLNQRVVDYSERLLQTFEPGLNRVFFGNSGSEANELALRISRQLTGAKGLLVSDYSYHGTTITLAEATTGLVTREPLADWVRPIHIPDMALDARPEEEVLADALAQVDAAIASLFESGHGLAACVFDPLFSTEGLPRVPAGFHAGVARRVRDAGGFVIADEVQSGFGRTGSHMWGYQATGLQPDIVTMGKPMANGHPMSAAVTSAEVMERFAAHNEFFNTFAGNPVSAAAGEAVLLEMEALELMSRADHLGVIAHARLREIADAHPAITASRGQGMFLGLEFARDGEPAPDLTKSVVESMKAQHVLISRIGPNGNVLKVRPPLAFEAEHLMLLLDRLDETISRIPV